MSGLDDQPISFTYDPTLPVEQQWIEPDVWTMELAPETLELFAKYSHVTDKNVIRKRAAALRDAVLGKTDTTDAKRPYKCVYQFWFLRPFIGTNPTYVQWKQEGKLSNMSIIDIGCCMGTDARYMIMDGVGKVVGIDYSERFIRAGFELFQDQEAMEEKLFQVDFLEGWQANSGTTQSCLPTRLQKEHLGKYDAACASMVLHVFETKEEIREFILRAKLLLKPGGVFFGRNRPIWVHTADSLAEELKYCGFVDVEVVEDSKVHMLLAGESDARYSTALRPTCFKAIVPS